MRKFTVALCLALAGVTVVGCGNSNTKSPTSFCHDYVTEVCTRAFQCYDAQTKATPGFMNQFGASQDQCVSMLSANLCATVTDAHPCADAAKAYHPDKAASCVDDLKAADCSVITGGTFTSANCDNICS